MKFLIASDLHGSAFYGRKLIEAYEREKANRMIWLGDLLYHGPRNDLPEEYAPKEVIRMLNSCKDQIFAVRGNCEAQVDQMVLEFPVLSDSLLLCAGEHMIYATHGHIWNKDALPPLKKGDILLHGHTHVWGMEKKDGVLILNPGSVSIPKQGKEHTYAILEGDQFCIKDLEGRCLMEISLQKETE